MKMDRSSVGFVFAKEPVRHEAITNGIANGGIKIPANDPDHAEFSRHSLKKDVLLLSFMPHMHLRGKSFRYTAKYPDGRPDEVLLSVPAYDFNWQSYYNLAEPKHLPAGTTIICEAHYDNSKGNLANPDPDKEIRWGQQTFEEMMIGYIDYVDAAPIDAKPSATQANTPEVSPDEVRDALQVLSQSARLNSGTSETPR